MMQGSIISRSGGRITRRAAIGLGAAFALVNPFKSEPGAAKDEIERHGISAFGDLKYPRDFRQFDYVDPQAPKGGTFSQIGAGRDSKNRSYDAFGSLIVVVVDFQLRKEFAPSFGVTAEFSAAEICPTVR